MTSYIPARLRELVHERASFRCEYCLLHRDDEPVFPHEIARKHAGPTQADNLALACFYCNRFKGSDLASVDPLSGNAALLFNPRRQVWAEHFALDGPVIVPLTAAGRATAYLLKMNRPRIVQRRAYFTQLNRYP